MRPSPSAGIITGIKYPNPIIERIDPELDNEEFLCCADLDEQIGKSSAGSATTGHDRASPGAKLPMGNTGATGERRSTRNLIPVPPTRPAMRQTGACVEGGDPGGTGACE